VVLRASLALADWALHRDDGACAGACETIDPYSALGTICEASREVGSAKRCAAQFSLSARLWRRGCWSRRCLWKLAQCSDSGGSRGVARAPAWTG